MSVQVYGFHACLGLRVQVYAQVYAVYAGLREVPLVSFMHG